MHQGQGVYEANLRIPAITKQDTETQYILTAYNDMGSQEYFVQISTSPEPEGEFLTILLTLFVVEHCFTLYTRNILGKTLSLQAYTYLRAYVTCIYGVAVFFSRFSQEYRNF